MSDQYSVLGDAPKKEDLKKLSSNTHLTITNLSAGYGKMAILHDFDLFVDKAPVSYTHLTLPTILLV